MKRALLSLLALAALGLLFFALFKGFGKNPREVPFQLLGQPAPAFSMHTLEGEEVSLQNFRGRPLIINFWSSWCGPCAEEAEVLEAAFRQRKHEVAFLGVVFEDSEAKAKNFLKKYPSSYAQLFSPVSTMAIDYAVTGVPETYFIDAQGNIAGKYAAPILNTRHFDALLRQFLPPPPPLGVPHP
ncbi:MAG: TlpA family protein disulfide reductase [Cystobacterineae bacterium]|nr:TlpA family protein disulfide reductase [Cystobacterineae bacterium]